MRQGIQRVTDALLIGFFGVQQAVDVAHQGLQFPGIAPVEPLGPSGLDIGDVLRHAAQRPKNQHQENDLSQGQQCARRAQRAPQAQAKRAGLLLDFGGIDQHGDGEGLDALVGQLPADSIPQHITAVPVHRLLEAVGAGSQWTGHGQLQP